MSSKAKPAARGLAGLPVELELITPELATKYLEANQSNRRLRQRVVDRYKTDMNDGNWTPCPAPIVFYADGDIADGQHRLWAIIESGVPVEFFVMRNLPREAGLNVDMGVQRSVIDNARISGEDGQLSNTLVAICRAVEFGAKDHAGARTNSQVIAMVAKHREAADWAVAHGPKGRGLRNSLTMGALARAFRQEPNTHKLERFSSVFSSGFVEDPSESAAIAMRNYFMLKGPALMLSLNWRDTFLKMQNSIWHFMRGTKLTVIRVVSDEMYPLVGKPRTVPKVAAAKRAA